LAQQANGQLAVDGDPAEHWLGELVGTLRRALSEAQFHEVLHNLEREAIAAAS
jgi:hypothetical protein